MWEYMLLLILMIQESCAFALFFLPFLLYGRAPTMMMIISLRENALKRWNMRSLPFSLSLSLRESSVEKMHAVPRKVLISPTEVKELNGL